MAGSRVGDVLSPKYKFAKLSVMEFREHPGEIIEAARRGSVFLLLKNGKPTAVLSALPGAQLDITVNGDGSIQYGLSGERNVGIPPTSRTGGQRP